MVFNSATRIKWLKKWYIEIQRGLSLLQLDAFVREYKIEFFFDLSIRRGADAE